MKFAPLVAGLALSLVASCDRPSSVPDSAAHTVRDSAGIQIFENQRPMWSAEAALHLSAAPILEIGNESSTAYQFSRLSGPVRLEDGSIVAGDADTCQLRFFDAAGKHLRSVGRCGEGPGEFERREGLELLAALAGDTLVAGPRIGDLSYFTPSGEFIRRTQRVHGDKMPIGPRPVLAAVADQSVVVALYMQPQPPAGVTRWTDSLPLFLVDRNGGVVRELGRFPYLTFAVGKDYPAPPWLGATMAIVTSGSSLIVGFGNEYSIRSYSLEGKLERIVRRRWTPHRITPAEIDEFVAAWSRRWVRSTGAEAEEEKREMRESAFADTVPAYSQFIADRSGRLWVREVHLADAPAQGSLSGTALVPSVWSVFDSEGRWLGDVTVPALFTPTDIGADYVLGTTFDQDGVPKIVLYRLE